MVSVANTLDESTLSLSEFAAAWAAHEQASARLALVVAGFDNAREFSLDGSVSMTAWLRHHCRMSRCDATSLVRRGRFLHRHDAIAAAAVMSKLSAGQVRAMQSNVTTRTQPVFDDHHTELVEIVAPLTVRQAEHACRGWRQRAEALIDGPEPEVPERELSFSRAGDGTLVGRFTLDSLLATEFERAIGTATAWEGADDTRSPAERNADALFDICSFFNANHDREGTPRHRPHVELNIEASELHQPHCCGSTVDGDPLTFSATEAYLCDSKIQRFVRSANVPLTVGRETRTVPLEIFRAVAKRDRGCRHPGCNRKVAWCEAHHVQFWRHMGLTELANLVLLCSRHHHLIHRPGWDLKLLPDGTVVVTTPEGATLTSLLCRDPVTDLGRQQT